MEPDSAAGASHSAAGGMRAFLVIWFGQLVSIVGSGLTSFALGVWVYLTSGSLTHYSLITMVAVLPTLALAPFAGAIVDRYDRRRILIYSDLAAGLNTFVIAALAYTGLLQIWNIYLIVAVTSVCNGFRGPAFNAASTLLVPSDKLGRAAGLSQMQGAASRVLSPALAGFLMTVIGLPGVVFIDVLTFLFSIIALLIVRTPMRAEAPAAGVRRSILAEAAYGWTYTRRRRGLVAMFVYFAICNLVLGIATVLFTPFVLSFGSAALLGTLMSVGGFGMVAGSVFLSVWGGPKKTVNGVLAPMLVVGVAMVLVGARPAPIPIAIGAFTYLFAVPILTGCWQVIIQKKVEPAVQGRVFAIATLVSWSSLPLAYLVAAPLVEKVVNPLLAGPLSETVGAVMGTGPGRAIGFLFVVMAGVIIAAAIGGFLYKPLRFIDTNLPDAADERVFDNSASADLSPQPELIPENPAAVQL